MNTNILKKFAQQTRTKLMEQISSKLEYVLNTDSVELREKSEQVNKLKEILSKSTKQEIVERVSYTWFNRLMALRFMDVNDYQPIGTKVVTPNDGYTLPEILDEAKRGHISEDLNLNRQKIFDILDGKIPSNNPQNEAYKELLIASCNHLSSVFPFLFERINDYTELLLPDDLTSELSIIQDVRDGMSAEDCKEVEIIGWLYQFYISEKKDEVFASKKAVKKEDIPAATQLFTPRWIVEYMVQNTVGKLWLQNRPDSKIREHMEYYIESPSSKSEDYLKLDSIEDLTLLDQACGSGHILVYGFDLLYKIYEEEGYNPTEIPELIITKNLHGFEIDERASQLAGMALMMKARSYHRRFFKKQVEPHILTYQDVSFNDEELKNVLTFTDLDKSAEFKYDLKVLEQATNYGSLIIPKSSPPFLADALKQIGKVYPKADVFQAELLERLTVAVNQLLPLSTKYHCIVDNPPYMGARKMEKVLLGWLRANYKNSYQDLSSCFVERASGQLLKNGLGGFITLQAWMFISSFENFRDFLLRTFTFSTLTQIGGNSFPSMNSQVARAVVFTILNNENSNSSTLCFDLDSIEKSHNIDKQQLFLDYKKNNKVVRRNFFEFRKVNRFTFLHSVTTELLEVFQNATPLENIAKPRQGLATGNNDRHVRYWFEVNYKDFNNTSSTKEEVWEQRGKWVPYNKGGNFRKWYGNNENVISFDKLNFEVLSLSGNHLPSKHLYFREGITYSLIGNSDFCARKFEKGFLFDVGGSCFFPDIENNLWLLGLVNSSLGSYLLSRLNPTVNFQVGDIGSIPVLNAVDLNIKKDIENKVEQNIEISKAEWNSYEENYGFLNDSILLLKNHTLLVAVNKCIEKRILLSTGLLENETFIDYNFDLIYKVRKQRIAQSKKISLYGNFKIDDDNFDYSHLKIQWTSDIITNLISYAVGCMFGRYSLDKEGLILANQGETLEDYLNKVALTKDQLSYLPDEDNIIPVLDDEWFEDDIVNRFYAFLKATFGKENFDKNLAFVEECLGTDIRKYFVKSFYNDHIKRYKKRPIYWMFSSPKGSFNVLIYMHRYTPDTLNKILNGYLIQYREKLNIKIENLDHIIVTGSSADQTKAQKEKDRLKLVIMELVDYEREILRPLAIDRISIDLDDGVLVNYNKFGKAIKDVAGLNDAKTKKKVREFDWINTEEIR